MIFPRFVTLLMVCTKLYVKKNYLGANIRENHRLKRLFQPICTLFKLLVDIESKNVRIISTFNRFNSAWVDFSNSIKLSYKKQNH